MKNKNEFKIKNKVWMWPGEGSAWHFVTIPPEIATKIKEKNKKPRRGFGAIKVEVKIGKTKFQTSIFPNKRDGTYFLPIKKGVRKREGIQDGDVVDLTLILL